MSHSGAGAAAETSCCKCSNCECAVVCSMARRIQGRRWISWRTAELNAASVACQDIQMGGGAGNCVSMDVKRRRSDSRRAGVAMWLAMKQPSFAASSRAGGAASSTLRRRRQDERGAGERRADDAKHRSSRSIGVMSRRIRCEPKESTLVPVFVKTQKRHQMQERARESV
jgi:hypothetical protein